MIPFANGRLDFALDALLDASPVRVRLTTLITAIGGMAGVGKTALAVQWAHRVTGLFPDGQLYVDLRGYDPERPLTAGEALAGFLRSLGIAGQDIPPGASERAARYRSLLAVRRMLVVLDNARDADQVRLLLPGTPGCATIVTSRDALPGLVARDGARRVDLDLLPQGDAVSLLRALIGSRVDAEPAAAVALAACCSRLPLALRVAAELAVARPGTRIAELAAELSARQRLDVLEAGGDAHASVRAVFSWSCRNLDPDTARLFHLAAEHPGSSYDARAVAALTDFSADQAERTLDRLCRTHLVQAAGRGRYSQHDLLRAYAREGAGARLLPNERCVARMRLADYYLQAAEVAISALFSAGGDRVAALAWLDRERANLVAIAGLAMEHQLPEQSIRLARTLFRYLDSGGHFAEASLIHGYARRAAAAAGDSVAEANALTDEAIAEARQCSHQEATGHLEQALDLFRKAGDLSGEGRALANLGTLYMRQGRYREAITRLQEALPLTRQAGRRAAEASVLNNLGLTCLRSGRYQQAVGHLHRSLAISREECSLPSQARALNNLGDVETLQGLHQRAGAHLQESLTLFRQMGDRIGEAYALVSLGELNFCRGRLRQASSRGVRGRTATRGPDQRPVPANARA